ncbi:MAG: chorismate-binding protein, partial [Planctomycetota bacterium]
MHATHTDAPRTRPEPVPLDQRDPRRPLLALYRAPSIDPARPDATHPTLRLAGPATRWLRADSEDRHAALQTLDPQTGERLDSRADPDPLASIERVWLESRARPTPEGGWLGRLYYRLGAWIEPTAGPTPSGPLFDLLRLDEPSPFAHTPAPSPASAPAPAPAPETPLAGDMASNPGAEAFQERVRRVLEYLRDGDIFQANLAHELRGPFVGDPRRAFATLAEATRPLFGALIQTPRPTHPSLEPRIESTLSMSPELFLDYDADSSRVVTRPMKGTRPLGEPGAEADLEHAAKDHAELAMITDLMRNDLGRVCAPGTIRVASDRALERHAEGAPGAILQATATVEGRLASRHGLADLLRATFPPGSVTGAPKIRAMQIIDE